MSHHYPLKSLFVVLVLFGTILNISTNLQSSPESLKSQETLSMISSGNEISPKHSAIENTSSFSTQLLDDSEFLEPSSTSPWNFTKDGDLSDTDGLLEDFQAKSNIIGDSGSFSVFDSNFSLTNWNYTQNPDYPTYPNYKNASNGFFNVSHIWDESAEQSTCAQLERNYSTSVNMSDYVISSASISAVFNASVHANNGAGGGIDAVGDSVDQHGTYDYARFYILISDLNHQRQNEVAYNQTVDLGQDSSGTMDTLTDTFLTSVPEETLILYLTSALDTNGINFTVSLGIRIWSEDNFGSDNDIWDTLILKNFSLNFNYEKKIDQGTFISLNQIGNKIDSSFYSGNNLHIQIDNATLNFGTKINGIWPVSSPNSEIRVIINGYQHTETIKLENLNSSWQFVKAGNGFDVSSFIHPDENISLQIQIYIADTFQLLSNLTISLDNVTLDVGFTVITDFEPYDTSLLPVESISPEIQWNESFSIQFNYTNTNTSSGIENSDFNVVWLGESIAYNEISNGIYQINATTDPNKTVANSIYPLEITANPFGQYLEKSLKYEIKVIGRSTRLDIFLNEENMTESPIIEIPYQSSLNISALYYDTNSLQYLQNASGGLSGGSINSSAWNVTYKGDFYEFSLNTTELGLGTHLITLDLNLDNYIVGSKLIRVEVISRFTDLFVKFNGVNATNNPEFKIPINEIVNLSVLYQDHENSQNLVNASITLEGINSTSYNSSTNGTIHQFSINTSLLEIKTYYVWVKAELENYEQISYLIEIEIVPRITSFLIQLNGTNMMNLDISNEISIPITTILNFTASYSDFDLNYSVPNGLVSISNFTNNGLTKIQNGDKFEFIINSSAVGLGSYFITLAGTGNEFYQQQSQILQLNILQIKTKISTLDKNNSYIISPGENFTLQLQVEDLDFNEIISNCLVEYSWKFGSGELNEISNGIYNKKLTNVPEGIYQITISVSKPGEFYRFQQFTVTLSVVKPTTEGLPKWLIYPGVGLLGGLIISFIAYQQYFKYPKIIREIHAVKRKVKHGKSTKKQFLTKEDLLCASFQGMLAKDGLNYKITARKPADKSSVKQPDKSTEDKMITESDQPESFVPYEV